MKMILVLILVTLSGCATPYQPMGWKGGYEETPAGDNKYIVEFRGNAHVGKTQARNYALRRAGELCVEKGYRTYDLVGHSTDTRESKIASGQTVSKASAELLITCVN